MDEASAVGRAALHLMGRPAPYTGGGVLLLHACPLLRGPDLWLTS